MTNNNEACLSGGCRATEGSSEAAERGETEISSFEKKMRDRLLPEDAELKYARSVEEVRLLLKDSCPGYFIRTFGCQQNEADSERIAGMAEAMGFRPTEAPEEAKLIVVNTCAVREHAEKRALSVIGQYKHLKKQDPGIVIAVCGCMASRPEVAAKLRQSYPYVDFSFGTSELFVFPQLLLDRLKGGRRTFRPAPDEPPVAECIPVVRQSRYSAWVSIMYGCNNFCTYCVVPYVRGRERSRRPEAVLSEIGELVSSGCREITLLGQNVNSYGKDCSFDCSFAELLRRADCFDGDYILRFMTSHPKDATEELTDVIAGSRHIARQFHLPAQSGSTRILRAMNRGYTREDYLDQIRYIRSRMPDCAISTDIMVGFPGETEEDFAESLSLLSEVGYDMVFSFIYSPREGTPAARMEQIPDEVKGDRMRRLLDLQTSIASEKNMRLLEKTERVLCFGPSKTDGGMLEGRDGGNKLVLFEGDRSLEGSFVDLRITEAGAFNLRGEICRQESKPASE